MKMLGYKVHDGEVRTHRFFIKWGTDKVTTQPRHKFVKLLGGNANITGGYAQIRQDIKKWTNKVTAQLSRWPVSAGVAIAIIEGMVENRMVFKGIVNIPSDGQLDELTGMVTRAFRGAFGIPRRTPRECVYEVVGRTSPDQVLWTTALVEYHKAMNSPSEVLKAAAWHQWQNPDLHKYDKDVSRLRKRAGEIGVEFHRVGLEKAEKWELNKPQGTRKCRIMYIFGDASNIPKWGGAAKVMDDAGRVWLQKKVTLLAHGMSTKLVEATMIAMAYDAVREAVVSHDVEVHEVWAWSDCLGAIHGMQSADVRQKQGLIVDRVITACQGEEVTVNWGWVQAQHDSHQQDWISRENQLMDEEAKEGAHGRAPPMRLPVVWLDGKTVLPFYKGEVIGDLRKFLLSNSQPALQCTSPSATAAPGKRAWTSVFQETAEAMRAWRRVQPLALRDWGEVRTWCLYASAHEWEWEGVQQHCPQCEMWCDSVRHHLFHECMVTKLRVYLWVQELCRILQAEGVSGNRIQPTWGGVRITGKPRVDIVWSHPSRASSLIDGDSETRVVWPVWLGLGPIRGIAVPLARAGARRVQAVILQVLEAAHVMVHSREEAGAHSPVRPSILCGWRAGTNSRVVSGINPKRRRGAKPAEFPVWWVLSLAIRPRAESTLALLLQTGDGIHATEWNPRVPDVWMGQAAGPVSVVASEAVRRGTQGKTVYWCLVHSEWGWRGCRKDSGVHLWCLDVLGVAVGWAVRYFEGVQGVQPDKCAAIACILQVATRQPGTVK